jgi:hypothetical protein
LLLAPVRSFSVVLDKDLLILLQYRLDGLGSALARLVCCDRATHFALERHVLKVQAALIRWCAQ